MLRVVGAILLVEVVVAGILRAAPAPASAAAPGPAPGPAPDLPGPYAYNEYGEDWANEWKHGDYPSWKETYPKDGFPGRHSITPDHQSDGRPTPALTGPHVGAYLKHSEDGTIRR